jgi:ribosomal-protein-alanine N-acetyltransferase
MERIPGGTSPSLQETQRRLSNIIEHQNQHGFSLWAVIEKNSGKLIGDCGLIFVGGYGPEIEISYDIAYEFWGKGYATEAARKCLRFGVEKLKLKRIIGLTYGDHIASRRVMENSGMIYEKHVYRYDRELVQYTTEKRV